MSNSSEFRGDCVAPFMDESLFDPDGGFIKGRFCAPISFLPGEPSCCLPCPVTDWTYSEGFNTWSAVGEWLNVAGLVLMSFMLISYAVLPLQQTRSHYLSVCLIVSVMMIGLGFAIPLGAKPEQCFDAITPNDMYTSNDCALSGAFIVAGGLCAVMWIVIRALSMNLQIVWDIVPGEKFFYASQALGWGICAAFFTATITVTGVSFRFGNACHVNHAHSMGIFWGPLIALTAIAGILQLITFGHCLRVYLSNLLHDRPDPSTTGSSSGLPSFNSLQSSPQTARAVWRRLKKVLWLQWRGICIITIILVDVIFFSVVFVYLDGMQQEINNDFTTVREWLICLAMNADDSSECEPLVGDFLVNEHTVLAVLVLLGLTGIQVFIFLTPFRVFPAWIDYIREKFGVHRREFVSLDARQDAMRGTATKAPIVSYSHGAENTTFEMQKPSPQYLPTNRGQQHARFDPDSKGAVASPALSSPADGCQCHLRDGADANPYCQCHGLPRHVVGAPLPPISDRSTPVDFPSPSASFPLNSAARGRFPPEYVGSVTPDLHTPAPLSGARGGGGAAGDYFAGPSSSSSASAAERTYRPPGYSFSAPQRPMSREEMVEGRPPTRGDPMEGARGGLGLNPPDEGEEWGKR